jgi:hypothetical protein
VPIADVSINALNTTLYSVTASTMTLPVQANSVPPDPIFGFGGSLFNLIDVARAYDANFTSSTAVTSLALSPKTATNTVGTKHCVVATTCNSQRTQASIFGQATVGGSAIVGYQIDVVDNGEPGSSDHYRIRLSNGYDSGDHTLDGGNIQIH